MTGDQKLCRKLKNLRNVKGSYLIFKINEYFFHIINSNEENLRFAIETRLKYQIPYINRWHEVNL